MSKSVEVQEYLDHYLEPSADLGFAVMLSGEWGSGKTHFIKRYFKERESKFGVSDDRNPSYLYASLYGVRSPSEITDQFFSQCNPLLGSKAARVLGSVTARLANVLAGADAVHENEDKSLIHQILLKLEGKALIFDDLERCAMPVVDVMGFINSYVEHEGLKVIIIASEKDIPEEQKKEYQRRKEKLVGKTLQIFTDARLVLDRFCGELTDVSVREAICDAKEVLLRTFDASPHRNFRSLRSILFDFERLVNLSDERLKKNKEAMNRLLVYALATALEFRAGSLRPQDLDRRSIISAYVEASLGEVKKNKLPIDQLRETYKEVDWNDPIIPSVALFKLFETGVVETDLINEHLAAHPLIVGVDETPAWRLLWGWEQIPQTQFNAIYFQFKEDLRLRVFKNPGLILHVAGICISLKFFNADPTSGLDVVDYFEQYLQDVGASIEPDTAVFEHIPDSYFLLGYRERDSSEFNAIYNAVRESTYSAHLRQMNDVANGFIGALELDPDLHLSLSGQYSGECNYSRAAFLHQILPEDFAAILINDGVINRDLCRSLCLRYELDRRRRNLRSEYDWLSQLGPCLISLAKETPPPHGPSLMKVIDDLLCRLDGYVKDDE